jgi:hypothetical protein
MNEWTMEMVTDIVLWVGPRVGIILLCIIYTCISNCIICHLEININQKSKHHYSTVSVAAWLTINCLSSSVISLLWYYYHSKWVFKTSVFFIEQEPWRQMSRQIITSQKRSNWQYVCNNVNLVENKIVLEACLKLLFNYYFIIPNTTCSLV